MRAVPVLAFLTTAVWAQTSSPPPASSPAPPAVSSTTAPAASSPPAPAPPATTPAPPAAPPPGFVPLAEKRFEYTNLPYKVDTDTGERGTQFGYNRCNSTTEGPTSLCQTSLINSVDDFCLWGPPLPDSLIGNTEGEAVAWCTKPGRGTRLIPAGALTAVQFIRTPDYVQVTGRIKQQLINIKADDSGGEMDPHGADRRGNPLGGLLFSNAFPSNAGVKDRFQQVIEWHNFMGDGLFCLKACDPAGPNAARFCEHIYDRIGCWRNAPAAYVEGVFESCDGENQDFPGVYTGTNGVVSTYSQPPESLGPITTVPYNPRIPATSNCVPAVSSLIYAGAPSPSIPISTSAASTTGATTARTSSVSRSSTGSAAGSTATGTNSASTLSQSGSSAALILGAIFAIFGLL